MISLYDLMIIVFKEGFIPCGVSPVVSPSQLPSFSIDVFSTIERFNDNPKLITKGMTILSLFNCLGEIRPIS